MPVTRSATRAAARSTRSRRVQVNPIEFTKTAKTTKAKTVKAKTKQPDTLSATRAVSLNYVSPRGRLLEWISLKDLAGGVAPDNGTLFGILQELCRQKGCRVVARGRPHELSGMEWLIIEWQSNKARREYRASALFPKLEKAISPRLLRRELIWSIYSMDCERIIRAKPFFPPQKLYEILTVYLPVNLDDTTVSSLEELKGPSHWTEEAELGSEEDRPKPPLGGFLSQNHGWMKKKVEYCGKAARRLLYFFEFEDEDAERHYKENIPGGRRVMEHFLENLQKLGMLGYESQHVRFLEVLDYVSENGYISLGLPASSLTAAEQKAYYEILDGQDADI